MINKKSIKKIHFVGIKGVGMTPLAIIAKEAGFEITGSDVETKFITDKELENAGIKPIVGFSPKNIEEADLVIATGAHGGKDNPEVVSAIDKGISVLTQGDALGLFQTGEIFDRDFYGISVAGSHGKTTTTAIIATMLKANKLDPSFVIGTGEVPSLGSSGHFGKGKYFIAEADEYVADVVHDKTPKFLFQNPNMIVVTNIDYDHPDVYESIDQIRKVFVEFTEKLPPDGVLVACGDGPENRKFLSEVKCNKVTYGLSPDNDYSIEHINSSPERMFFRVKSSGADLGEFSINVFGEQNALNALASIVAGFELGLSLAQIKSGISSFKGTKRRSEFLGKTEKGGLVYDDYAHHPEEIKKTLNAFRKTFPKHKIYSIFQPHMYSRTIKLFKEFSSSFVDADLVIITDIFPSFREEVDPNFSSLLLVEEINKYGKKAHYLPESADVIKYLSSENLDKNTLVLLMGAGDIYLVAEDLIYG